MLFRKFFAALPQGTHRLITPSERRLITGSACGFSVRRRRSGARRSSADDHAIHEGSHCPSSPPGPDPRRIDFAVPPSGAGLDPVRPGAGAISRLHGNHGHGSDPLRHPWWKNSTAPGGSSLHHVTLAPCVGRVDAGLHRVHPHESLGDHAWNPAANAWSQISWFVFGMSAT